MMITNFHAGAELFHAFLGLRPPGIRQEAESRQLYRRLSRGEALVETIASLIEDRLATRQGLKEAETALRRDMKELETALRHDMKEMEISLKRDLRETELRLHHDLTLRLGAMLAATVAIVTAWSGYYNPSPSPFFTAPRLGFKLSVTASLL